MRSSGIPLSHIPSLPRVYQDQIAAQLRPRPELRADGQAIIGQAPKRLRQSSAKLNKTEQAFLEHLQRTFPESTIHVQAITLKLANGVRYTPDFVVAHPAGGEGKAEWFAYETKGFMREDAAVKIKCAAKEYSEMTFILVTRRGRASAWDYQKILK